MLDAFKGAILFIAIAASSMLNSLVCTLFMSSWMHLMILDNTLSLFHAFDAENNTLKYSIAVFSLNSSSTTYSPFDPFNFFTLFLFFFSVGSRNCEIKRNYDPWIWVNLPLLFVPNKVLLCQLLDLELVWLPQFLLMSPHLLLKCFS